MDIRCFVHLVHASCTLCCLEDTIGILRKFVTRGKIVEEGVGIGDWGRREYTGETILGCSIAIDVSDDITTSRYSQLYHTGERHIARRVTCQDGSEYPDEIDILSAAILLELLGCVGYVEIGTTKGLACRTEVYRQLVAERPTPLIHGHPVQIRPNNQASKIDETETCADWLGGHIE